MYGTKYWRSKSWTSKRAWNIYARLSNQYGNMHDREKKSHQPSWISTPRCTCINVR